jgi:hypothetical protein
MRKKKNKKAVQLKNKDINHPEHVFWIGLELYNMIEKHFNELNNGPQVDKK